MPLSLTKKNSLAKVLKRLGDNTGDNSVMDGIILELGKVKSNIPEQYDDTRIVNELSDIKYKHTSFSSSILSDVERIENRLNDYLSSNSKLHDSHKESIIKVIDDIEKIKKDVKRLPRGGGSMPRRIQINSSTIATRYSDINFIASGWTASNNNITHQTDITVTAGLGTNWADDTFSGDGSTISFTLTHSPVTNSVNVYFNGNRQSKVNGDYSLTGSVVTFLIITPQKGDQIEIQYAY